jgi:hypothetical protein
MIALLLGNWRLVAWGVFVLSLLGLGAYGVHAFHERDLRLIEQGRQEVRDSDLKEAQRAGEFATAVANHERDALVRMEHRNESFDRIKAVVVRLPAPIRGVRVAGDVVRLLDAAVGQANALPDPPPGLTDPLPPLPTLGSFQTGPSK